MEFQMTKDIIEFVRGESRINRNRQVMKPEFGFLVAHANVNMGGLVSFIGIEESPIRTPNAEPSALIRSPGVILAARYRVGGLRGQYCTAFFRT
jgi:hypothetical protein